MFDSSKKQRVCGISVEHLMDILKTFDPKAEVHVGGDARFWIHSEKDGTAIVFDTEDLDDAYEEEK